MEVMNGFNAVESNVCGNGVATISETVLENVRTLVKLRLRSDCEIKLISEGVLKGQSGDKVYHVMRKNTIELLAVAKIFHKKDTFENECKAIEILKSLKEAQKLGASTHIENLATFPLESCFLMLQSPAAGKGLDDYLEYYFKTKKSKSDEFIGLMKATARAFAELHRNTISSQRACIDLYVNKIRSLLGEIPEVRKKFEEECSYLSSKDCSERINRLITRAEKDRRLGSIIHGDGHPGNIFANFQEGRWVITWIDTDSLYLTTNGNELKGHAPPERDYSYFLVHLRNIYLRSMLELAEGVDIHPKYHLLKCTFKKEYEMNQHHVVKSHKDLQAVRGLLASIIRSFKRPIMLGSHEFNHEWKIRQLTILKLEKIVKKY